MMKSIFLHTFCVVLGMVLIGLSAGSSPQRDVPSILLTPPSELRYFTLGYNESVSDSLWIRAIQDLDLCEQSKADVNGSAKEPSESQKQQTLPSRCNKGWVYRMLDSISELTPKFRSPYLYGSIALSVIVDDREGATAIFEKGLKHFPKDWKLAYQGAYHYIWEVRDERRAADLLIQAGKNGAPDWVFALAAKLYAKDGRALLARTVLEDALQNVDDPESESALRIKKRLNEINKQLAEMPETQPAQPSSAAPKPENKATN